MPKYVSKRLKVTFLIHAVLMAVFALIYLIIPVPWGNLTGCLSNQVPQVFRLFGMTLLALGAVSFLAFRENLWERVRLIALLNCLVYVPFSLLILLSLLLWDLPSIGWLYFGMSLVFGTVFILFYPRIKKPVKD